MHEVAWAGPGGPELPPSTTHPPPSLSPCPAGVELTFHRAFDVVRDQDKALEDLMACGVRRVLTSGGRQTVMEGLGQLASLVAAAGSRLSIMPGEWVGRSCRGRVGGREELQEPGGEAGGWQRGTGCRACQVGGRGWVEKEGLVAVWEEVGAMDTMEESGCFALV